jgi:ribosomal protein S18 acetylase RimI-like enzyme
VLRIRPAGPGDAEAIARVLEAGFAPLRGHYTPAAYAATVPPPDAIRARFPAARAWLAELHGEAVGTVTVRPAPAGAYIQSMAVVPAARGLGVGRRLLEEAVRSARSQGAGRAYLSTAPFLAAAIGLYRSFGFVHVPEGPPDLHGTPLLTMALGLGQAPVPASHRNSGSSSYPNGASSVSTCRASSRR